MPEDLKHICNQKVFKNIVNTYSKELKRFLFFKTRDIYLAEDILQDAFIKLWDNCGKVDYRKVRSFLYKVATNLFLNIKKHEKVVQKHQSSFAKESTSESPEFIMLTNEFLEKIDHTIASLPEKQREVFLLSRIEKKKYKEIAAMLNISVKAVEKRMHIALLVLKEKIGNV
jgi:RNA polymerase sigma-70 factor (family 1)